MLGEYFAEQIEDRVSLGAYMKDDVPSYNPELVVITDHDNEARFPLTVEGKTTKKVCNDYDEHCSYCKKLGCKHDMSISWKAFFLKKEGNKLTYFVRERLIGDKIKGEKQMELSLMENKEVEKDYSDFMQKYGTREASSPYKMFIAGWKAKKLRLEEQEEVEIEARLKHTSTDTGLDRMLELVRETTKDLQEIKKRMDEANDRILKI
jgi:hypothetical protein